MKIERGCVEDSPIPDVWQIGEYKFQRCPVKIVDQSVYELIQAYNFYKSGYLPNTGGWLDQSCKFIGSVQFIENEIRVMRKEQNG